MEVATYLPNHNIAGTVRTNRRVETRSIEADSASAVLYRAAKSTTTLESGKLQHRRESLANGLTTCSTCRSTKNRAARTNTLPRQPRSTPRDSRIGCAARPRPAANRATPEVADQSRSYSGE